MPVACNFLRPALHSSSEYLEVEADHFLLRDHRVRTEAMLFSTDSDALRQRLNLLSCARAITSYGAAGPILKKCLLDLSKQMKSNRKNCL